MSLIQYLCQQFLKNAEKGKKVESLAEELSALEH